MAIITPHNIIRLQHLLASIPRGRVMTYGAVARALDLPSPRQAGALLKANPQPDFFPCYKVVRSDGHLGGYVLGTPEKIKRLRAEGILIKNNRVINFDRVRYAMMTEDAQHLRTTTT